MSKRKCFGPRGDPAARNSGRAEHSQQLQKELTIRPGYIVRKKGGREWGSEEHKDRQKLTVTRLTRGNLVQYFGGQCSSKAEGGERSEMSQL